MKKYNLLLTRLQNKNAWIISIWKLTAIWHCYNTQSISSPSTLSFVLLSKDQRCPLWKNWFIMQTLHRESHLCMLLLLVCDSIILTDRGTDNRRRHVWANVWVLITKRKCYLLSTAVFWPPSTVFFPPLKHFCLLYTSLCLVLCKITSFMSLQDPQGSCVTVWSDWELQFWLHLIILLAAASLMQGTLGLLGKLVSHAY